MEWWNNIMVRRNDRTKGRTHITARQKDIRKGRTHIMARRNDITKGRTHIIERQNHITKRRTHIMAWPNYKTKCLMAFHIITVGRHGAGSGSGPPCTVCMYMMTSLYVYCTRQCAEKWPLNRPGTSVHSPPWLQGIRPSVCTIFLALKLSLFDVFWNGWKICVHVHINLYSFSI